VAGSTAEHVRIHYRRIPDREDLFVQRLVHRQPDCVVTFLQRTPLDRPVRVRGRTVLEDGSPVVWFTFPGRMHDIGAFHLADGTFTGHYANILTPVADINGDVWQTTDLLLDVWCGADTTLALLDEAELNRAEESGWIGASLAARARAEAATLLEAAAKGEFPPPAVRAWTLERVLANLAEPDCGQGGTRAGGAV
jgi:predicted RNA-binding protein associated with RNAse of E/G family